MSIKAASLSPPANLAEVMQRILSIDDLAHQTRQDLVSALRQVARLIGGMPADVPANPEALRRALSLMTPAAAGMTPSRFGNVKSYLTAALDLTGAKVVRRRRMTGLAPSWRALLVRVEDRYERARLSRFFTFASANGVEPDQVDDQVVSTFAESLKRNSLLERQTQIIRDLCITWNRCAGRIAGWPAVQLTVPNRRRDYALPITAYPASFGEGLEAYLAHLASDDLFSKTGRGPASPVTLRDLRFRILEMAAALVHSGRAPDTIGSLADLVAPAAVKTALQFLWSRSVKRGGPGLRRSRGDKRTTGQIHNFALTALKIAKHWVESPQDQIEQLQAIRGEVAPEDSGMTVRNRARLRQFDDPENLQRLINLPQTILRALPPSERLSYDQAVKLQSAVAIGILLDAPLRAKNLAALHLGRHVHRTRAGGARQINIPAEEVKNRSALAFEVSDSLGQLTDAYLARGRPILVEDADDGYVFPARKGGGKTPGRLAEQIKRTIVQETGIILNAHAFRHLSAKLFLAAHPGEYETVRLFLGHKSLTTTIKAYCGLEQADALRRLDALIDSHRKNP
jgi:integrase